MESEQDLAQAGGDTPLLSIVVLAYRSGVRARAVVAQAIEALQTASITDFELILVGNYVEGENDETPEVVRELAASYNRVRCCVLPKKGWMGWDMRKGLDLAKGDLIAVIDGDGQMPVVDVVRLFALMSSGECDLAKTYRVSRGDGWKRRLISTAYNLLFRVLFPGIGTSDANAKPKMMTRAALEGMDLHSDDWFIDAEIMLEARRANLVVKELPTNFTALEGRASFVRPVALLEFLRNLLKYRLREFKRGSSWVDEDLGHGCNGGDRCRRAHEARPGAPRCSRVNEACAQPSRRSCGVCRGRLDRPRVSRG